VSRDTLESGGRDTHGARVPRGAFAAVTLAYWAFMLTDGALRMLVLLHFHTLGFTPLQLAWLFLLYELAGVATNLGAGWLGARFGLNATLFAGLLLQVLALLALAELDPAWSIALSVAFVALVQGVAGVAKDLTKTGAKSAVKRLAPSGAPEGTLFRLVALLTGSKNAVKGLGFFVGTVLLGALGFRDALFALAFVLVLVFIAVTIAPPPGLGAGKRGVGTRDVLSSSPAVNRLSAARVFLFGARDTWFVVGVPIWFHDALSDGTASADARAFALVGGFMALWIIAYGIVQAGAPTLLRAARHTLADSLEAARRWAGRLTLVTAVIAAVTFAAGTTPTPALTAALVLGLLAFGAVFAINSSLHSYLILALAGDERLTMDVGLYYSANALGRLLGTLLSGLSYQAGGLSGCLVAAALMAWTSRLWAGRLARLAEAPASLPASA